MFLCAAHFTCENATHTLTITSTRSEYGIICTVIQHEFGKMQSFRTNCGFYFDTAFKKQGSRHQLARTPSKKSERTLKEKEWETVVSSWEDSIHVQGGEGEKVRPGLRRVPPNPSMKAATLRLHAIVRYLSSESN